MSGRDEFEFANDARAAMEGRAPRSAWVLILVMLAMIAIGVTWASMATLEEVTTANGKVISSSQLQVVQTLEGGIVREIFVQEGDLVEKGQALMQIDDTGFSAKLGQLRQQRWARLAEIARLKAEAASKDKVDVSAALRKHAPQAIEAELASFLARRAKRKREHAILAQQLFQKQQELLELKARLAKLEKSLAPLNKELKLTKDLHNRGVVPEIEMLRLERQFVELSGEVNILRISLPRAQSAIDEARNRLASAKAIFHAETHGRLAKVRAELAVTEEALRAARDRVARTTLRSPAKGVVNKVNVTTIGAVVQPGLDVFTIVPRDDRLLIEAQVSPKDVAFINTNQKANVKLTAYDYLVFGAIPGKVVRIGADTITDGKSQTYYRVIVETERNYIENGSKKYPIIPGMIASVDILTGEKTVLTYLLKPINRARNEALRER